VAWGGGDSGEGVPGAGPDQVGELGEKVGKRRAVGIWVGWRGRGDFRRGNVVAGSVSRGGRRGEQARGRGLGPFYSSALLRRREGEENWSQDRAAPAVPSDAWQLLGSGGPTWQGEGRTAEAAQAVAGGVGRRVEGRCRAAGAREAAGGGWSRVRAEAEELGDSRKTMEDLSAISQKSRDPTIMYR
jgi:hypothetical protein